MSNHTGAPAGRGRTGMIKWTYEQLHMRYASLDGADSRELADAIRADIAAVEAERDELKRRLDAVVMEHIRTAELKCYCEFDRDHTRTLECEYCEEVTSLRAIAEGRDNG